MNGLQIEAINARKNLCRRIHALSEENLQSLVHYLNELESGEAHEPNEERRQAMTKEAYRAEVRADALFIQEKILKIREKRLSQNKSHSQIPHYPASSSREHTSVPAGDC